MEWIGLSLSCLINNRLNMPEAWPQVYWTALTACSSRDLLQSCVKSYHEPLRVLPLWQER